eukprot:TRINITY_DN4746_c0_g1_i1.p1 TRINITY_DN4746_c0_g1~~TRINITY_DN4746_c0_g1_i1.p1  ORF type:complete len:852 (+),score=182.64 TRINITY_DN4746_c0_g1_i1:70-2556(+)
MALRLRDLIKTVRTCKTAAEERATIAKECAAIRTAIKEENTEYRQRNVAKLLYIHMLGYPTHFGQMECFKLIVSQNYSDKRIGYLGLMLLLDERQEVLMLITNSLRQDMLHQNQFVVGLALCALANLATPGIARDLSSDVGKLMANQTPYIRKKAALCAIKLIRKAPELIEFFVPKIRALLGDRNHGVLLTAVTLIIELCEMEPQNVDSFRKLAPALVRILKNLVLSGYAPEYDIAGITDPFLQVKLLKLLRILGKGDTEASDVMNDTLAQIATNTDSSRNVGNSILYECVQTIMRIESESGLRVLAINILGRFLLNRDNNIRYVALNTLSKVVSVDAQAIQRHRSTIVDCLKDHDISIRRRALELVYALVNETNIRMLVRELLAFLMSSDLEFRSDLTAKICMVTEKYAPTKKWHVDTILRVISIAGEYVPEQVISNLIGLITQTPELHLYAVHKLYSAILSNDLLKQPLIQLGAWCIGEFGDVLTSGNVPSQAAALEDGNESNDAPVAPVTEADVIGLLERVLRHATTTVITKEIVLTALVKLSDRFQHSTSIDAIRTLLDTYKTSIFVELQQRSCEYAALLTNLPPTKKAVILERMPAMEEIRESSSQVEETTASAPSLISDATAPPPKKTNDDLLADIFAPTPQHSQQTTAAPTRAAPDLLADIFGGSPAAPTPSSLPIQPGNDIFGGGPLTATPALAPTPAAGYAPITVYQRDGISIVFELAKQPGNPSLSTITVNVTNSLPHPINNFVFSAAVPKYIKLQLGSPSGTSIPPSKTGSITQQIKLANSLQGQKPVLMKAKIEFTSNMGQQVSEMIDISNFPPGF